jgi:hypothetical protein
VPAAHDRDACSRPLWRDLPCFVRRKHDTARPSP